MNRTLRIESAQQFSDMLGLGKVKHDKIIFIDYKNSQKLKDYEGLSISSDLYTIAMKDRDCGFFYGREYYDFSEGTLIYTGPNQVVRCDIVGDFSNGWFLIFHPDLLSKFDLGRQIHEYSFFNYDVNEALHISEKEKNTLNTIVEELIGELDKEPDNFTDEVIVSNLELILKYSKRFYGRQFITREVANKDIISRFDRILSEQININHLEEEGQPTVKGIALELGYSPNYLSDLLKKETGLNPQEHIQSKILDLAKTILLSETISISEISYQLGFSYPANFSNFFKNKTGMSPNNYRKTNL